MQFHPIILYRNAVNLYMYPIICLSLFLMCCCVQGEVDDVFRFTTFCVQFVCYLALFVLNLIPEPHSISAAYTLLQDDITEVRNNTEKLCCVRIYPWYCYHMYCS